MRQPTIVKWLWACALFVPLLIIGSGTITLNQALERPFFDAGGMGTGVGEFMLAALPFALLAAWARWMGQRADARALVVAALVGFVLTVPGYVWLYYDLIMPPYNDGANIGLGIILSLSPVYIGVGMILGYVVTQFVGKIVVHQH